MPKRTSFNDDWLKKRDCNGHTLQQWCEKGASKYEVFCRFCKKNIKCDNRGLNQLIHHSQSHSHTSVVKDIESGSQMTFTKQASESSTSQSMACWSTKDNVIKAELLWAMKVAHSNYSFNSAQHLGQLFCSMFPDSDIASKFHIGSSKLSYLISEATGPHFHEVLLYDVVNSKSPFSISFDELTNKAVKKQLDLKIRYWSDKQNLVAVHHLDTYLMGQAKGTDVSEKIMKSIDNGKLPLKNLIALGNDGPNVNKTVFRIITEIKKQQDLPELLDIGTCTLHMVHNAFGKAVREFGSEIVEFVIDLHNFFRLSPVRTEELKNLQDELGLSQLHFLKHVECRWITLGLALERVKNQWPVVSDYFLCELPKRDKKLTENARYKRIVKCLNAPNTILAQIHFLLTISNLLEPFLKVFQCEEPHIHVLYDHMNMLIMSLFGRFVKADKLRGKTFDDLKLLNFPCINVELSDTDLEIGVETRKVLEKLKQERQKGLISGMRKFYYELVGKLLKKMPLDNVILKGARCLIPGHRCETWTVKAVKDLAIHVPLIPPLNVDCVADEWKVLQCENVPKDWYCCEVEGKVIQTRIDQYWSKIFSLKDSLNQCKYPQLMSLVKAVLIIPHGNADVERGFSQTSNYLTDSRTRLSQASVSALQSTKDGLKLYGYEIHQVPITKDFIKKGINAHKSYLERLEEEKRIEAQLAKQKEQDKEKKKMEQELLEKKQKDFERKSHENKRSILQEKSLQKKEAEATADIDTYKSLVEEANARIKNALQIHDMKGVQIGQTMLEAACKKVNESTTALQEIRNEQREIEKTKRTMLDYFCASQAKKHKPK